MSWRQNHNISSQNYVIKSHYFNLKSQSGNCIFLSQDQINKSNEHFLSHNYGTKSNFETFSQNHEIRSEFQFTESLL